MNATKQPWRRESKKVEVVMVEESKKATKGKKRERSSIPPPFTISTKELYSILEAWLKDGVVVLPKCKHEPIDEEKRGPLYCRYHRRCDHHIMDCYALRNIFHEKVAKGDLVIKGGKRANSSMRRPEVAMTLFISHEDPMEEQVENMASSNSAHSPLQDEEMILRIQQDDKIYSFLEGIGLRPLTRREAAQTLTRVMENNQEVTVSKESLVHAAYQEARDSITFSNRDWPIVLLMTTDFCILLPFWEPLKSKGP